MDSELKKIQRNLLPLHPNNRMDTIGLYPGIEISYLTFETDSLSVQHKPLEHILEINYCRIGRVSWRLENGKHIYLGPGDFSIHTMKSCADSLLTFPTGLYKGLTLFIDLQELSEHPPQLLADTGISKEFLCEKFCSYNTFTSFGGNMQTESIFTGFFNQPRNLNLPYQKLKALELLLYLCKTEPDSNKPLTEYQSEQIEIVRKIHEQLIRHMNQKITIDELSRQYLINPTTLKSVFKSVYGASIATHVKKHRMEQAARLLRESNLSVAEIAQAIGYESQSKFTSAFKATFDITPKEYRRKIQIRKL